MDTPSPSFEPHAAQSLTLTGLVAAAVTPVRPDLTIDVPRLVLHVKWLLSNGCDMVSLFGSSGEGPSFSVAQRLEATAQVIGAGVAAARLVPAVIATGVQDARNLLAGFAALRCRAALVMPPFFFGADDDGVMAFFEHTVGPVEPRIPVLLYHYPAMSRFGFGHDLIARLCDRFGDQIVGIKDSSGDRDHGLALISHFPRLSIFTGTDTDLCALVAAGGAGAIGGVPNANAALLGARLATSGAPADALDKIIAGMFAAVAALGGPLPLRMMVAHVHDDPEWLRPMPPLTAPDPTEMRTLIAKIEAAGYALPKSKGA